MAKIILSFDDGRRDNYVVAKEILEPLKIPATFNITYGYILGEVHGEDSPGPHMAMSIEELLYLSDNFLFEIAGHGYKHNNNVDNLIDGANKLRELLNANYTKIGIASPHSKFDLSNLDRSINKFYNNNICYLRISNDYEKMTKLQIWIRRINRLIHSPYLFYSTNANGLITKPSDFLIHSVPVIKSTSLKEVLYLVNKVSKSENCVCILMFHSILRPHEPYYDDLFSWEYNRFRNLCINLRKMADKNEIELIRTIDLFSN